MKRDPSFCNPLFLTYHRHRTSQEILSSIVCPHRPPSSSLLLVVCCIPSGNAGALRVGDRRIYCLETDGTGRKGPAEGLTMGSRGVPCSRRRRTAGGSQAQGVT